MRGFFKHVFSAFLGVLLAIAFIVLFFVLIGSLASLGGDGIKKNSVLKLNFSTPIPELTNNNTPARFQMPKGESIGLARMTRLIDHAASDNKIKGILLNANDVRMGQATAATLRNALERFKDSGKFIYSYADMYGQTAYYLSSVADSVFLNPIGMVDVKGFGILSTFFKDALERLGIKMEVFYAGNFKSATEPFRRNDMSEYNKIQLMEFLESLVGHFKSVVASSRNMAEEDLDRIMSESLGRNADLALENHLVDALKYWDEVEDVIKEKARIKTDKDINYVSLSDYNKAVKLKRNTKAKHKIALVFAEGTVTYDKDKKGTISQDRYRKIFEDIAKDNTIDAVVFRVNSGGGSGLTSEIIWHAVEKVKAAGKPVIGSMGDYAASGGYYILAGADTIVASPNTLTGSIGVFSMVPNISKFAQEKLGLHFDGVKTHPHSVGITMVKEMTDEEKQMMQTEVDRFYQKFLNRVAEGRDMAVDDVHQIAQGRIWTGTKAKEIGLVDVLGGLDDAMDITSQMIGADEYRIKVYPKLKVDFVEQLINQFAQENAQIEMDDAAMQMLKKYDEVKEVITTKGVQARLPFLIMEH